MIGAIIEQEILSLEFRPKEFIASIKSGLEQREPIFTDYQAVVSPLVVYSCQGCLKCKSQVFSLQSTVGIPRGTDYGLKTGLGKFLKTNSPSSFC